ncbi:tetratricopeptide repeat protein [Sphingomonas sp. 37zxx]|uniref:tetratricopeptide repeat protein n=1 Tax=Sphingomonas sp. 37zxx TaxID=1550073 RepID=UPI00053C0707|nr:tetratricopeptide repeat protein [Sphingomonas sp. 37zxx]
MRLTITMMLAATMLTVAPPVLAQTTAGVEGRIDRLEREMRAVQRKVFPGGAGQTLEPQIAAPVTPQSLPGTPATSAVADLNARVNALEAQLATMTGQIEQGEYRLRQMEQAVEAYRKTNDARIAALESGGVVTPAPASAPGAAAAGDTRPAASGSRPAVSEAATAPSRDPARAQLVSAVARPATGDAAEDSYTYGFRLWQAKLYPEAQAELKKFVAAHPNHRRASFAQNLLGRAYLDEGKPSLASIAFYENYKKMPDGERAPDSLFYLGQALVALKKPADACKVYGELTDVYSDRMAASMVADVARARTAAKCG